MIMGFLRYFKKVYCNYFTIINVYYVEELRFVIEENFFSISYYFFQKGLIMFRTLFLVLAGLMATAGISLSAELAEPIRLEAAGKPIDTEIGHAAPFVCDFDGDGLKDLLVGQFGEGLLRIYRNEGTNSEPKLAAGVKFKEGKEDGRVPSG